MQGLNSSPQPSRCTWCTCCSCPSHIRTCTARSVAAHSSTTRVREEHDCVMRQIHRANSSCNINEAPESLDAEPHRPQGGSMILFILLQPAKLGLPRPSCCTCHSRTWPRHPCSTAGTNNVTCIVSKCWVLRWCSSTVLSGHCTRLIAPLDLRSRQGGSA